MKWLSFGFFFGISVSSMVWSQNLSKEVLETGLKKLLPNKTWTEKELSTWKGIEIDLNKDGKNEWVLIQNPNETKKEVPPQICPCNRRKWRGRDKILSTGMDTKALYQIEVAPSGKARQVTLWLSSKQGKWEDLKLPLHAFCKRNAKRLKRWKIRQISVVDTDRGKAFSIGSKKCILWSQKKNIQSKKSMRWFKDSSIAIPKCPCVPVQWDVQSYKPWNIWVVHYPKPDEPVLVQQLQGMNPQLTPLTKDKRWIGLRIEKIVPKGPIHPERTFEELFVFDVATPNRLKKVFRHLILQESDGTQGKLKVLLSYKQMDQDDWIEIVADHFYEDAQFHGGTHRVMYKWHRERFVRLNEVRGILGVFVSEYWKHPVPRSSRNIRKLVWRRSEGSNLVDGFANTQWVSKKGKRSVGAFAQVNFSGKKKLVGLAISVKPSKVFSPMVADLWGRKKAPLLVPARFVKVSAGLQWSQVYTLQGSSLFHFLRFPKEIITSKVKVEIVDRNGKERWTIPADEKSHGTLSEIVPIESSLRFVASSYYAKGATVFPPSAAGDGLEDTAWGAGGTDFGKGEWLQAVLSIPQEIKALGIINGCHLPGEKSILNNRLKEVELRFSDGSSQIVTLKDSDQMQTVAIQAVRTSIITLVIRSIYKGKLSNITCLSELRPL